MVLKYAKVPQVTYQGRQADAGWHSRFPSNARPMGTAPITATQALKLFEPTGKYYYGIHHLGGWKEVGWQLDADGKHRVRMTGNIISNPVAWSSS